MNQIGKRAEPAEAQEVTLVGDGATGGSNSVHRPTRRNYLADCF